MGSRKKEPPGQPVDLNRASRQQLQTLPGIGPKMADAILAARAGKPFASVEDLRRVKGIGPKTLERLRPHIRVESP
jgi:competence protein ComEA